MRILSKIFYLPLVLHYAVMDSVDELMFNALHLGHSGLLITWKPKVTIQSKQISTEEYTFFFKEYIVEERNYENSELDDHQSHEVAKENKEFNKTSYDSCKSSAGQFKIHSLKESTLYEIIIQQYNGIITPKRNGSSYAVNDKISRKYSVKMKTNPKSTENPAKPHFEFDSITMMIRWYPCGRERICHNDQESGTHFGIRVREPYNTRKWIEVEEQEFHLDHMKIWLWANRIYEIVVFSVNGEHKTDSETQEIFLKPMATIVQYVNTISLPDASVLISWKPPKMLPDESMSRYMVIFSNQSEANADMEAPIFFPRDDFSFLDSHSNSFSDTAFEQIQIRIFGLKLEFLYYFIIVPITNFARGLEYRIKYQLEVFNNKLPIAKPDFNYFLEETDTTAVCRLVFQWLPCGQSFNCENSRPGSNYYFEFSSQPILKQCKEKYGYCEGLFYVDSEFHVNVTSSIENNFSKPAIKYFKKCNEIRNPTFKNIDEL